MLAAALSTQQKAARIVLTHTIFNEFDEKIARLQVANQQVF